jgi:hypothetical protein
VQKAKKHSGAEAVTHRNESAEKIRSACIDKSEDHGLATTKNVVKDDEKF